MFSFFKKKKIIITHNGTFHADDVFACATLEIVLDRQGNNYRIVRTRDEGIIKKGDYVVDVGGIYDPTRNFFDHHQVGGAGARDNAIPYASFGLVWREYGEYLTGSFVSAKRVDDNLVTPVDANDNGVSITKSLYSDVNMYSLHNIISAFLPSWKEVDSLDINKIFEDFVEYAKALLKREIKKAQDLVEGEIKVRKIYEGTEDKRIIIIDSYLPWKKELSLHSEPLFFVGKESSGKWSVSCVRNDLSTFINRKNFPAQWAGLKGAELQKITGVADAVFCHTKLFFCVAESKEGAIRLAHLALEN